MYACNLRKKIQNGDRHRHVNQLVMPRKETTEQSWVFCDVPAI